MLALQIASTSDVISAFDWWSGVWIPVIVGVISVLLTVLALVLARLANRQAITANTTADAALRIAEESLRLAQRQNEREEQMPRERVIDGAIREFNKCCHTAGQREVSLVTRFMPVMAALTDLAGAEGIAPISVKSLTAWLRREALAIEAASTTDPAELYDRPSRDLALLAFRLAFSDRCDEWSRTGEIHAAVTVESAYPDYFEPLPRPE